LNVQPLISALLNGASAVCLLIGFSRIRRKREEGHRNMMITAAALSILFLVNYLIYHAVHGHTPYSGQGAVRTVYFIVLISHTILAVGLVPLAARTLYLGWKGRRQSHRRIARVTLPVWLYVSITGVTIYLIVYVWD
jgi:uncharacterized membrane protein YozB (DUF420 family)